MSRLRKPPVIWCEAPWIRTSVGTSLAGTGAPEAVSMTSILMPWTRLAKAAPHRIEGVQALIVCAQSQRSRQAWSLIFSRHSIAQIRTMRHRRMRRRTRYAPEKRVPYHSGKAAKVAPPAVNSQTSLPSQWGPMVPSMARRSLSSRPRILSSMPTPKSKPSRVR